MLKHQSQVDPLSFSTFVFAEYRIARELKLTYTQWKKLPRKERRTWYLFFILSDKKEEHSYEKAKKEAELRQSRQHKPPPIHQGKAPRL